MKAQREISLNQMKIQMTLLQMNAQWIVKINCKRSRKNQNRKAKRRRTIKKLETVYHKKQKKINSVNQTR